MDGTVRRTGGVVHGAIAAAPAAPIRQTWGKLASLVTEETASPQHLEITEITINPGSPPGPRHYHARTENAFIILEGNAVMELDGSEIDLAPGDFAWVPIGVTHQVRNVSDTEPVRLIEVYGPPRHDDFNIIEEA